MELPKRRSQHTYVCYGEDQQVYWPEEYRKRMGWYREGCKQTEQDNEWLGKWLKDLKELGYDPE